MGYGKASINGQYNTIVPVHNFPVYSIGEKTPQYVSTYCISTPVRFLNTRSLPGSFLRAMTFVGAIDRCLGTHLHL